MKRILLCFVLITSFAYVSKLNAQACAVTNTVISNISTNTGAGGCTIKFDLQFDLSSNSGIGSSQSSESKRKGIATSQLPP